MDESYYGIFENNNPEPIQTDAAVPLTKETDKLVEEVSDDPTKEAGSNKINTPEEEVVSDSEENIGRGEAPFGKDILEALEELKAVNVSSNEANKQILSQLEAVKSSMERLSAYDTAVNTLRMALTASQNTEKKLYDEVEEYRKDAYLTNIKPFLKFMISMLNEFKTTKKQYMDDKDAFLAENSESIFKEIINLLDYFIVAFENQLQIQGVDIIAFESGSDYIPVKQQIRKTHKTDVETNKGKVAEVLSDCYMYGTSVLEPSWVIAYKFESTAK